MQNDLLYAEEDRDKLISSMRKPTGSQGSIKPLGPAVSPVIRGVWVHYPVCGISAHSGIKFAVMSFLASYSGNVINGHQTRQEQAGGVQCW